MISLVDLLKGTPHEGEESTPSRDGARMEEIEAALVELAELIVGGE